MPDKSRNQNKNKNSLLGDRLKKAGEETGLSQSSLTRALNIFSNISLNRMADEERRKGLGAKKPVFSDRYTMLQVAAARRKPKET